MTKNTDKRVFVEELKADFEEARTKAQASVTKFKERLEDEETSDCYAFSWADDAVQGAAEAFVYGEAAEMLEHVLRETDKDGKPRTDTLEDRFAFAFKWWADEAERCAERVNRSTSGSSNMLEEYKRAAKMKAMRKLRGDCLVFL